jgi:hypothetical protein
MVWFAFSVEDQVEKYGAYVGIAAFFGLAVLSLLYFSQARELKRLREWAGRAPERAQELEERVVTEAAAASRKPTGVPLPQRPAPPRRLAEMPEPAGAAGAGQATELAEAVDVEAEPATNGNLPRGPGGTVPVGPPGANGAAPATSNGDAAAEEEPAEERPAADRLPAATAAGAQARAQEDDADRPAAAAAGAAAEARAPGAAGVGPEATAPGAAEAAEPGAAEATEPGAAQAATPGAAQAAAPGAAEAAPDRAEAAAPEQASAAGEAAPPRAPAAGDDGVTIPRATPAQRPAAAPMPLRQSQPAATAGRRPAPAPRRPAAAPPRKGRSGGTIALLVGLAVLILGGGAFAISQLGGGDTPPKPNQSAPPTSQDAAGTSGQDAGSATPPAETTVSVLNGTTFNGLARQISAKITADGFRAGTTATNTRDQSVEQSVVYYADGFRAQGRRVAGLLDVTAVRPLDAETQALAPQSDIVVLAGADQAP